MLADRASRDWLPENPDAQRGEVDAVAKHGRSGGQDDGKKDDGKKDDGKGGKKRDGSQDERHEGIQEDGKGKRRKGK